MDRQEWFEKHLKSLGFEMERYRADPSGALEEWQIIKTTLIKLAISMLPGPERQVARLIFLEDLTEQQTANKLGLSRIKVHRLKWKAKGQLSSSPLLKFLLPAARPIADLER